MLLVVVDKNKFYKVDDDLLSFTSKKSQTVHHHTARKGKHQPLFFSDRIFAICTNHLSSLLITKTRIRIYNDCFTHTFKHVITLCAESFFRKHVNWQSNLHFQKSAQKSANMNKISAYQALTYLVCVIVVPTFSDKSAQNSHELHISRFNLWFAEDAATFTFRRTRPIML